MSQKRTTYRFAIYKTSKENYDSDGFKAVSEKVFESENLITVKEKLTTMAYEAFKADLLLWDTINSFCLKTGTAYFITDISDTGEKLVYNDTLELFEEKSND